LVFKNKPDFASFASRVAILPALIPMMDVDDARAVQEI